MDNVNNCCSIGKIKETACSYRDGNEFISVNNLKEEEKELLVMRTELAYNELIDICIYHKRRYLTKYQFNFGQECCDPFQRHKKRITKGLREITISYCKMFSSNYGLAPGKKICSTCRGKLQTKPSEEDGLSQTSFEPESDDGGDDLKCLFVFMKLEIYSILR